MPDYPDTPITREEQYLAAGLDGGDLPDPITREEQYLYEIATKMQGGGPSVTVEPLTVTQNGTTTAPSGKAYSPVTTNVPNSYGASDEGKVVNNGALVAQTAHAPVTANGTIDTTLYNSVPVDVEGNPNYVETISGTVDNPWGTMTTEEIVSLIDAVIENAATIKVSFQRSGKNYAACATQYVDPTTGDTYDGVSFNFLFDDGSSFAFANVYAAYVEGTLYKDGAGVVSTSFGGVSRQSLQQWAQTAGPTTMTIIHHPLPDSE